MPNTADTGQEFTPDAISRAFELTAGQPWLVNALAAEIVDEMAVPVTSPITVDHLEQAKERLILARATHLDSLVDKLREPRVHRVVEPLLAGTTLLLDPYDDDLSYARDLGIVAPDPPVRIANPIYREIIPRVLAPDVAANVTAEPRSFVRGDGRLDFPKLLDEFAAFWRTNGDILVSRQLYHEAAPQLVMMAFLQRLINGGGYVEREYGVGRGRIDLLIRWPYSGSDGRRAWQCEGLELKVRAEGSADLVPEALGQLDAYLDRLGLDTGTLAVFDRRPDAPAISERTGITTTTSPAGRIITLLRG